MNLRENAKYIYEHAIAASMPDTSVKETLKEIKFGEGKIVLVAVGKAAWTMADAAYSVLGDAISKGVVVTKYDHSQGPIGDFSIIEAGHPVMDENSFKGAETAVEAVTGLSEKDTVLFLLSGGGSALFEMSKLSLSELQDINKQMLACGAEIQEINTIRKRLSMVKGGHFAELCKPAWVVTLALSDIIDNRMDMIASGPTCPDSSTVDEALAIVKKYNLQFSDKVMEMLAVETPKELPDAHNIMCGSVQMLCLEAKKACEELGYECEIITDTMRCTAKKAGLLLGEYAKNNAFCGKKKAFIAGGETVVKLTGNGLGGRNQEIALAAAEVISGLDNVCVFSVGSDGTDGPTDAAGGYSDGSTKEALKKYGTEIYDVLDNNDSYHALEKTGGLIITGPTGTNVCDVAVVLIN